jgi:hypothetical protein
MQRYFYILFLLLIYLPGNAQTVQYHEGLTTYSEIIDHKKQFGFKNKSGEIVIPARFDSVAEPFRMNQAIVIMSSLYGTIDHKGKLIISASYKKILPKQFDLTPVQNNLGLWGFYSFENKLTIPCLYDNFKFTNKGKHLFVQNAGKWGMIDLANNALVPFDFKLIESLSPKQVRGLRFNTWELFSSTGEVKKSYAFDTVSFTSTSMLSYKQNGWQGLLNRDGAIALKNTYEDIGSIVSDMVALKKDGYWGVKKINAEGWIIEPSFDIIQMDTLMIRAGITFGKSPLIHWKLYNFSGAPLYGTTITDYHEYSNGLMAVKSIANKWGFINEKGNEIIPFEYTTVGQFYYGLCRVEKNGQQLVINKSGDVVLNHQDVYLYSIGLLKLNALQDKTYTYRIDSLTTIIPVNEEFVKIRKGNKYGLINTKGETIFPIVYTEISIGNSSTTFGVLKDKQWKVQAGASTYSVDKKIISIQGFYNDYAGMKYNNGKFGFIDNQGKIRVAPQYDQIRPFENEIAVIQLNGKWGIINKYESFVAQPYYDSISAFKNKVAVVIEKGVYYLIDNTGKILTPEGYSSITLTSGGNYLLIKNNLKGIANSNGKEIISPRYQSIKEFSPNMFKVTTDNLMGVIDSTQKIILHIKYTEIFYNSTTQEFLAAEDGTQAYISIK